MRWPAGAGLVGRGRRERASSVDGDGWTARSRATRGRSSRRSPAEVLDLAIEAARLEDAFLEFYQGEEAEEAAAGTGSGAAVAHGTAASRSSACRSCAHTGVPSERGWPS